VLKLTKQIRDRRHYQLKANSHCLNRHGGLIAWEKTSHVRKGKTVMKIQVISGHGDGKIKLLEVAEGTTIAELLSAQFPDADISIHLLRVNRLPASVEQLLSDGDRLTVTPLGIAGASVH